MLRTIAFIGEGLTTIEACREAIAQLNAAYTAYPFLGSHVISIDTAMTSGAHINWPVRYVVTLTVDLDPLQANQFQSAYQSGVPNSSLV